MGRAGWLSGNNSNCVLETVGLNNVTGLFGAPRRSYKNAPTGFRTSVRPRVTVREQLNGI